MQQFVYGTDQQYETLKNELNDGREMYSYFNNCIFPSCCKISYGKIAFKKKDNMYYLYTGKGNSCKGQNIPELFKDWLRLGILKFLDFADIKEFFKSLKCLY